MDCKVCEFENAKEAVFCEKCGLSLENSSVEFSLPAVNQILLSPVINYVIMLLAIFSLLVGIAVATVPVVELIRTGVISKQGRALLALLFLLIFVILGGFSLFLNVILNDHYTRAEKESKGRISPMRLIINLLGPRVGNGLIVTGLLTGLASLVPGMRVLRPFLESDQHLYPVSGFLTFGMVVIGLYLIVLGSITNLVLYKKLKL